MKLVAALLGEYQQIAACIGNRSANGNYVSFTEIDIDDTTRGQDLTVVSHELTLQTLKRIKNKWFGVPAIRYQTASRLRGYRSSSFDRDLRCLCLGRRAQGLKVLRIKSEQCHLNTGAESGDSVLHIEAE